MNRRPGSGCLDVDTASLANGATYTYVVLANYGDGTTSAP